MEQRLLNVTAAAGSSVLKVNTGSTLGVEPPCLLVFERHVYDVTDVTSNSITIAATLESSLTSDALLHADTIGPLPILNESDLSHVPLLNRVISTLADMRQQQLSHEELQALVDQLAQHEQNTTAAAQAAAAAASAASKSESRAATSESNAADSATNAALSESNATASASAASASAGVATAAKDDAVTAKTAAEQAATNAQNTLADVIPKSDKATTAEMDAGTADKFPDAAEVKGFVNGHSYTKNQLNIIINDAYRQQVEQTSGGKNTVIYDDQGNPNVMVVIPRFNCEDVDTGELNLGTGTHPAFLTNGAPRSEFLIAKYLASTATGGTAVVGGAEPRASIDYDNAKIACTSKGSGWHLMSMHEWAAIALWSLKNNTQPRGNTYWGRSHEQSHEVAKRFDGRVAGDSSGTGRTATGGGPASWYHDGTIFGVADLVGNVWEWIDQMKLTDGRIITTLDNDPSVLESNWARHAAYYDGVNGVQLSDSVTQPNATTNIEFSALNSSASYSPNELLRRLLLETATPNTARGRLYMRNFGERMPIRGGSWYNGGSAGLAALHLYNPRSSSHSSIGFRPAFFA